MWLIGCGNMAGAMLHRWIETGALASQDVFVCNRHDRALPDGVRQGRALPTGPLPDAILLGVKPQQLDDLTELAPRIAGAPLLLSILAGVDDKALADRFEVKAIVRCMPNLPVAIGNGVVAMHGDQAGTRQRSAVDALMMPLGLSVWIDETQFDAVTALAGSGPAFVYRFIDAFAAAGVASGLPADLSAQLAIATVEGGALVAAQATASPRELADRVASRGGTTRAGLNVLDDDDSLVRLLTNTLAAAARRSAEMAADARGEGERPTG